MARDITPLTEKQRAALIERNRRVYNEMIRGASLDFVESIAEEGLNFVDFTCHNCALVGTCSFQFDLYNTNGDCLALK